LSTADDARFSNTAEQDDDPLMYPITHVAYQTGSSDVCMLWLGGQAAGQVSLETKQCRAMCMPHPRI
jgi:hypothetical protein